MSDSSPPHGLQPTGLLRPWDSPGKSTGVGCHCLIRTEPPGKPKNTGVGSLSLLQGIFPSQESNRGLLHCRLILYQLNYQGSPSLNHVQLFATPWTVAHQASLSFTISQSLLRFVFIESVILSNHLLLCCPFLLLPSVFPSIRVFSNLKRNVN